MTSHLRHVQYRMVAWSVAVISTILVAVGVLVYASTTRSLMQSVDATLVADSGAAQVEVNEGEVRTELEQLAVHGGVFYVIVDRNRSVVANPQQLDLTLLPLDLSQIETPRVITTSVGGDSVRIYARPVEQPGGEQVILAVGQSLLPVEAASHQLLVILLLGGCLGLLLSVAGGWLLASRALEPIQLAFERQQEFVADASHELRTPLTILHSSADLLVAQDDKPPDDQRAVILEMRGEVIRMERLTRDLLTLARSDRGELRLAMGRVDLAALAEEAQQRLNVLAQARGIRVNVCVDDARPVVDGDPDRLQQVALIVLDNALKHSPDGGCVCITVHQQAATAVMQVDDDGHGIPPEHLTRVFERFHRVDPSRSRATGGTGLGLAIARTLVAAHGGQITLANRLGGGTSVRILLPRYADSLMARHARWQLRPRR